jgi:hypothetical protein
MAKSAETVIKQANQRGVFGEHPAMTPKYAQNRGLRDAEFRETLARMFLSIADTGDANKQTFLDTLPTGAVRDIGSVLTGNAGNGGYIDFLLSNIQESFQEKVQVNEVLSDNYVAFFFGQSAPTFNFSGFLINSYQDDHRTGMHLAYQNLIRGTQLARRNALVRIRYDSVIVSGALLNLQQSISAENELAIPFSFQLLVKSFFVFEAPTVTQKVSDAFNPAGTAFPDNVAAPNTTKVKTTTIIAPQATGKDSVVSTQGEAAPPTASLLDKEAAARAAFRVVTDPVGTLDYLRKAK